MTYAYRSAVLALLVAGTGCGTAVGPGDGAPGDARTDDTSNPTPDAPGIDAAADTPATTDAAGDVASEGDGAVACLEVADDGAMVTPQMLGGPGPSSSGGPITPGHYVLTGVEVYNGGSGGPVRQAALEIQGDRYALVLHTGDPAPRREAGTFRATGHTLALSPVCPDGAAASAYDYDALATILRLARRSGMSSTVLVFTLR